MATACADCSQCPQQIRALLVCILLLGLTARLLHIWAIHDTTLPSHHLLSTQTDDHAFFEWARSLQANDWLDKNTFHPYFKWMEPIAPLETWHRWWGGKEILHQSPLYPYFLALTLGLCRDSISCVLLLQLLLGAMQPLIMYHLARRLWDVRAGLIAAGITAIYAPFIFHQGVLLRDWLPPILQSLAVLAVLIARQQEGKWKWLTAGGLLGLALLGRETALFLIAGLILWVSLDLRDQKKKAVLACVGLVIGIFLTLSPLILRNVIVGAPWLAFSNRAAEGIIEGWAADGFPVGLFHPSSMQNILEHSNGRLVSVVHETLKTYGDDRLGALGELRLKLAAFADPFEVPNNTSIYYWIEFSPVLKYGLGYGTIFPLAFAGFVISLVNWRYRGLLLTYACTMMVGLLSTIIIARYRLELIPVMILSAALFLTRMLDAVYEKKGALVWGLVLLATGIWAQQVLLSLPRHVKDYALSLDYRTTARTFATEGRFDQATAEMARLIDKVIKGPEYWVVLKETGGNVRRGSHLMADYEIELRVYRAQHLIQEGKSDEGRREIELAIDSYHRIFGDLPQESRSEFSYAFGLIYLKLNDKAAARASFSDFLRLESAGPRAERVRKFMQLLSSDDVGAKSASASLDTVRK